MVVLTGATSGIGTATARALVGAGATVFAVGRDAERTRRCVEVLRRMSRPSSVAGLTADLSILSEVRRVAATVRDQYDRVDVLLNNAGAVFAQRQITPEGYERTWALNVLAPFLLTRGLEDRLRAAAQGRVINVASAAHRWGHLDFEDPGRARHYTAFGAYGQSKLALILLTHAWAQHFAGTCVTVNALHPGFVASRFGRSNPKGFRWAITLAQAAFGISPERGARTSVYLATAPEAASTTGGYFVRNRARRSSHASYDPLATSRLWELCGAQTRG